MAARQSPNNDFKSLYFSALHERLDKQDTKLDSILAQTQKTNGRVTKLENKVFSKVVPWYSDSKLLYLAMFCLLVFLLIVAAFLKVDVPTGLSL